MTIVYILMAVAIAISAAAFFASRRVLARGDQLKFELQRQIDALSAEVSALKPSADAPAPAAIHSAALSDEITPATLATIGETIAALLGKKVRIRSVKLLHPPGTTSNPWAQHGRVVVQASRNFSQRRREP